MLNKILDWLVSRSKRMAIKKTGGIPIGWIIYKPWDGKPNIWFHLHPSVRHDKWLSERLSEIADYIRENYKEEDL